MREREAPLVSKMKAGRTKLEVSLVEVTSFPPPPSSLLSFGFTKPTSSTFLGTFLGRSLLTPNRAALVEEEDSVGMERDRHGEVVVEREDGERARFRAESIWGLVEFE